MLPEDVVLGKAGDSRSSACGRSPSRLTAPLAFQPLLSKALARGFWGSDQQTDALETLRSLQSPAPGCPPACSPR